MGRYDSLQYFANRSDIGGAELSHHSTGQQAICEQRQKLPYLTTPLVFGGAELSHHSTEQQAFL